MEYKICELRGGRRKEEGTTLIHSRHYCLNRIVGGVCCCNWLIDACTAHRFDRWYESYGAMNTSLIDKKVRHEYKILK